MKRMLMGLSLVALVGPFACGQAFFSDDFNTGGTAGALSRGWEFVENEFVTEVGSNFVIAPEWPEGQTGPGGNTGVIFPPTADGTPSDGGFLIANSDAGSGSDDIGSKAEIWAISPKFSTMGANEVWFHADTEIEVNNNGECLILLQVTADGGKTWIPVWTCVEPERVIDSFNNKVDTASMIGGWPEIGSGSLTKTFAGIHGRWHIQFPPEVANKPEVRFRIGFYEPADAWWIVMDNVVVDSKPAPQGSKTVLSEDFKNGIPSTWKNTPVKTQKWDTRPLWDEQFNEPLKWVGGFPVHIDFIHMAKLWGLEKIDLNNPDPTVNPKGITDGRWILMLAGQGYALWQEGPYAPEAGQPSEAADLDTPVLNLASAKEVFLQFDSEMLRGNNSVFYDVFVSVDGGASFSRIFTYTAALLDNAEAAYFMRHYLEVPQAAGKNAVIFRFHAQGEDASPNNDPTAGGNGDMAGFWVVDNVKVTVNEGTGVSGWMLQ